MFERQNYVLRDQYNSNDGRERKHLHANVKQHSCAKCFFNVCEIIPEESGGFTLCFKCDGNINPDKYFYIEC